MLSEKLSTNIGSIYDILIDNLKKIRARLYHIFVRKQIIMLHHLFNLFNLIISSFQNSRLQKKN
jgi:hypothetical protein